MKKQQQSTHSRKSPRTSPSSKDRQKHNYSPTHFASSAFLNSPDPSKLPVPDFDDEMEISTRLFTDVKTVAPLAARKTDTLKQFLNISSPMLTVSS